MTTPTQRLLHCPCGARIAKKGLCSTCYALKRQDGEYFGGHREEVLKRDDYRCRVPGCTTVKRGKRSVAVHHREPGNSDPGKMLTLCLPCHARVTRTLYVQDDWPEFLRVLWREQHPDGQEQATLNFSRSRDLPVPVPLLICTEKTEVTFLGMLTDKRSDQSGNSIPRKPRRAMPKVQSSRTPFWSSRD